MRKMLSLFHFSTDGLTIDQFLHVHLSVSSSFDTKKQNQSLWKTTQLAVSSTVFFAAVFITCRTAAGGNPGELYRTISSSWVQCKKTKLLNKPYKMLSWKHQLLAISDKFLHFFKLELKHFQKANGIAT